MALRLGAITDRLGGELIGDPNLMIAALAPLEFAGPGELCFLSNAQYLKWLPDSKAGCVIVAPSLREPATLRGSCIVTDQPYLYFAHLTQMWKQHLGGHELQTAKGHIHATAVVDPDAVIHPDARIGPLCVIERGARIGALTVLKSGVTVGEGCTVGERCILHAGVVIGSDGFGFAPDQGTWVKIEQLGAVSIGNDVEIGANTCIDRGALHNTVIEDGVKLDNLIQVGHNVVIGQHTAIAGCAGLAGSSRIGAHCTVGGGAVVLGHLEVADHVNISAASVVSRSINKAGHYSGFFPLDDNASWEKNAVTLKQLHALRDRVRQLENTLRKTELS